MSAEVLSEISAAALALLMAYIPGFKNWFDKFDGVQKGAIMAGLLALVAVGVMGLTCAGYSQYLQVSLACDAKGWADLVGLYFKVLAANQVTYLMAVRPRDNKIKEAARLQAMRG